MLRVVVVVVIVGAILAGWCLWRVFTKVSIEASLWDELGKSYYKSYDANTNSWSFNMSPNSEADLIISVWNDGTASLHDVSIKIEQISDGLTLNMYDSRPAQPSDTLWYLGGVHRGDGMTRGWQIFLPSQPGNYEIVFHVTSREIENRFTVIIVVS